MGSGISDSLQVLPRVSAVANGLRISPQKLSLIASLIRGLSINEALNQLSFSTKAGAEPVKKLLLSSVANAQNNFGLDIDLLVVGRVEVGKNITLKRVSPRARGRSARILKRYSHMRINLVVGGGEDGSKS